MSKDLFNRALLAAMSDPDVHDLGEARLVAQMVVSSMPPEASPPAPAASLAILKPAQSDYDRFRAILRKALNDRSEPAAALSQGPGRSQHREALIAFDDALARSRKREEQLKESLANVVSLSTQRLAMERNT